MGRITGLLMVEAAPSNLLGAPGSYAWDRVNKVFYGPKDAVTGWPPGDPMTEGPPGPSIQLQVTATHIQWRVVGTSTWTNLVALSSLKGADGTDGSDGTDGQNGADGQEVSLQTTATHIQWRLGTGPWTDLVALADLRGEDGTDGVNGADGTDGEDGREVQLQTTATHIQWRYAGDATWTDLIARSTLKGDKGDTGDAAWSPIYANVADGTRRVQRVVDWTGGQGTKPATGKYLGPSGLVDTAAEATDIRGASGAGTGDMLGSNNLNDVTDKAIARQNLSVWSRAEVGSVDTDYLSIVDAADPAGLSFAPTGLNFAKNTGRLDYVDAASSAAVPGLTYSRTGAATAWRKDGTLAEFAPNVMRRTDAGVTIEGQRTNLLLNSALAGGATVTGWSNWASPTHSDSPSTVLGTVRARSFSVTNARDIINATGSEVNMAPGVQYCLSVTVESISAGIPAREILHHGFTPSDASLSYPVCPANPSGGAMGIVQPGRLHILVTSATGGSAKQWRIGLGAIANVTGTARLSLPQLELGTRASTPIITTGAAATVGADNLALVLPAGVTAYRADYNGNQVAQGVAAQGAFDLATGRPWLNGTLQKVTFS